MLYERDNCNNGQWDWCSVGDGANEVAARHNMTANFAYSDGHTKNWHTDPTTGQFPILPGYRCWNVWTNNDAGGPGLASRWSGNYWDVLPYHDGIDVTCGGTQGFVP